MDELNRRTLLGAVGITGMAAVARAAHAGPLNPPSGAVAGTGRTVDEIFNKIPGGGAGDGRLAIAGGTGVSINNPGSYVLTGNVVGASGVNGITINADNVTLDLNGYSVSSAFTTGIGIQIGSGITGVVIRNGIINGFMSGVTMSGSTVNVLVENLLIRNAKSSGINIASNLTKVVRLRGCTICNTGSTTTSADVSLNVTGLVINGGMCVIEDCAVLRTINSSSGSPTVFGVTFGAGVGNSMARCSIMNEVPVTGTGVNFAPFVASCTYRDNTVVNFTTKYGGTGGVDAGGNV